jgi:hypothetical protein
VCAQACKEQYNECVATYSKGCESLGWKDGLYRRASESDEVFARTWPGSGVCAVAGVGTFGAWANAGSDGVQCWGWGGNKPSSALERCKAQYHDCLSVNQWVNPRDKCTHWHGC